MYYSININQIAIATHNKNFATNLDLIDGAIIVYLAQQSISVFAKKNFIIYENEVYYRICYDNIISQLPLINIENKEVIGRRIKKLEKSGVIKFYIDKKNNNKTYFTTTELFENFVSKVPTQKSIPADLEVGTHPTQKSTHIYDNDTNDNSTIYSKEKINKKDTTTASGSSFNENSVSVNNAHTQTSYQGNLDNSTGKENLQVESVADKSYILNTQEKDYKSWPKSAKKQHILTEQTAENSVNISEISRPKNIGYSVEFTVETVKVIEKTKRFQKPTVNEIASYCSQRMNSIDPQAFFDWYESVGWKVGKNTMKDWQACVRTWETRDKKTSQPQSKRQRVNYNNLQPLEFQELKID
jgi:hypothetical protein